MKGAILMIGLLLASLFAGAFALADSEDSIDVSEIESLETEVDDIQTTLEEDIEIEKPEYKKVGFAKIWRGHGWITNEEAGHLITGFWISQGFAKIETSNNEVENAKTVRTFGHLKIAGSRNYRLIRAPKTEDISNISSVVFYVVPTGRKKYVSEEELIEVSIGKLILNRKKQLKGLTTWEGTLEFGEGNLAGSWDVELATHTKTIRAGKALKEIKERQGPKKFGFWKKFAFWKRNQVEKEEFSEIDEENEEGENHEENGLEESKKIDRKKISKRDFSKARIRNHIRNKENFNDENLDSEE